MPDSNAGKAFAGRERKIERRRLEVARVAMTERGGGVGLVRRFVARETEIAIDAHHRSARRSWIRHVARTDFCEPWRERRDEREHRLAHLVLVARFILEKPVAVVVAAEFLEKFEELGREVTRGHRFRLRENEF